MRRAVLHPPFVTAWRVLVAGAATLVVLGPLARILDHLDDRKFEGPLEPWALLFDLQSEANLPTLYSACLFLLATATFVLWAVIGPRPERAAWGALAVATLVLAVDESTMLHERFLGPVGRALGGGDGFLRFAWVIPGTAVVVVGGAALWVVCRRLPGPVRRTLQLAAVVFFSGAIGLEALSGWVESTRGRGRVFLSIATVEEALEFTGALIAVRAGFLGLGLTPAPGTLTITAPVPDPETHSEPEPDPQA